MVVRVRPVVSMIRVGDEVYGALIPRGKGGGLSRDRAG